MNDRSASDTTQGKWISVILTVLVHVGLILFLFFGIRWQSKPAVSLEVELTAAPVIQNQQLPPKPVQPPPPVVPKKQPEPPPKSIDPPDIAVKKEPPPKQAQKVEKKVEKVEKKDKSSPAPKKETLPADTRYLDDLLKKESERLQHNNALAELDKKLHEETQRLAAARFIDVYLNAIRTKVRGNLVRPPGLTGNPEAVFEVEQLPSGEVIDVRIKHSSGIKALDDAIERAIRRSNPLPLPPAEAPELFKRELELRFKPLEE